MPIIKSRFTFAEGARLTFTEADVIAFAEPLRWYGEITCHRGASTDVAILGGRPGCYRCRPRARQSSIRTGTPTECSHLPGATWLRALWLIMSSSKGISSLRLADMLGIRQHSAWLLAHRVREMMARVVRAPISGEVVEFNEVYAGAKPRQKAGGGPTGMKSGRGLRRPLVLTATMRGGEARFRVIANRGKHDVGPAASAMVHALGTFMTDTTPAYSALGADRRSVEYSADEFARIDPDSTSVHVNTAESWYADLRPMMLGVHHWISQKHLDRYLEDLAFRRSPGRATCSRVSVPH